MPCNENYIHNCDGEKVSIIELKKSLADIYDENEFKEIIDFYLFHPLILKDERQNSKFGQKCLKEYQWFGNSGQNSLSALEGRMLKAASLGMFCILKSSKITDTIEAMGLNGDIICITHPRAVLKQNVDICMQEDGQVKVSDREKRLVCLFRHVRNSIAHNCTYDFKNGNIMLDDYDDESANNLSARILIPKSSLLEWKKIITRE